MGEMCTLRTLGSPRRKRSEMACHAMAANVLASTADIHSETSIEVAVRPMMKDTNRMVAIICETNSTGLFVSTVVLAME